MSDHTFWRWGSARRSVLVLLGLLAIAGCRAQGRTLSPAALAAGQRPFATAYEQELLRLEEADRKRILREYADARSGTGPRQSHDLLVLSGGGAFGAFGAGFLQGWGEVTDEEFARPEFDVVSGISTGALIAPFAFIGSDTAYETIVEHYRNPARDWVRSRGMIPYLPRNESLYDASGLRAHLRATITPRSWRSWRVAPRKRDS